MGPSRSELENDATNPCFGCGPRNEHGLRLRFERVGNVVTTWLHADHDFQGWPGLLHSGIIYTAMLETANWTVYGLKGRIGIPTKTSALDLSTRPKVGDTIKIVGRVERDDGKALVVEVTARDGKGQIVAGLTRDFDLPTRQEFLDRMGYDVLPEAFEGTLPEE